MTQWSRTSARRRSNCSPRTWPSLTEVRQRRPCCSEEQPHQLCHPWSRSYPPSPELLGATGPLPFPSLTPVLNEQASSIQSLASCQLLVLSLWICAVQQPTFSGECPLTKSSQPFGPLGAFFGLVRALMYPEVVLSFSAISVFRSMRPFCAYDPVNLSV